MKTKLVRKIAATMLAASVLLTIPASADISALLSADNDIVTPYIVGLANRTFYNDLPYITTDERNLLKNAGFESTENAAWNVNTFINTSTKTVDDQQLAHGGSKFLKFTASTEESISRFSFAVNADTDYYLTCFVRTPLYSSENQCTASFGIAQAGTEKFILMQDAESIEGRQFTEDIQLIPTAADDEWHLVSLEFNSGSSEIADFLIKGKNSVLYLDDIYIFESKDGVRYASAADQLSDATVTNQTAEFVSFSDDNILSNSDFSQGDIFWKDDRGSVFGDTLTICDTGISAQGNAMHYSNNRRYPNRVYYIKWLEVDPDTEYTFSARYCTLVSGEAFFGLISGYGSENAVSSGNEVYPTLLKSFAFDDAHSAFDGWSDVAVTFNTGQRNRVGFVVFDGGGDGYIDDLTLCKGSSSIGRITTPYDTKLISLNSGLTIKNSILYGVRPGTSIGELLSYFENNDNIVITNSAGMK